MGMSRVRLILAILGLLLVAPPSWGGEVLQAPVIRVGDWWAIESAHGVWRLTVEAVDGDLYVVSDSRDSHTVYWMDRNATLVKWANDSGREGEYRPVPYLKFPLDPGKSWQYMPTDRAASYSFTPEGWEEVDLGRRTVRALRIKVEETIRDGAAVRQGSTEFVWYSPDARRIVRQVCDCEGGPHWVVVDWGGLGLPPLRRSQQ